MSNNMNNAQLKAVNAENKTILVSAGAGTGKSTAMTERVMRVLLEGKADLSQMLVVTFTREAAGSIRKKIRKALQDACDGADEEKTKIARLNLDLLPTSQISTIHSFCGNVVRNGSVQINIDTGFQILDEGKRTDMFKQATHDAFEEISKKTYPKEKKNLIGAFKRTVSAAKLPEVCMEIYNILMGIPAPFEKLDSVIAKMDETDNPWKREILKFHKKLLLTKNVMLEEMQGLSKNVHFPTAALDSLNNDIRLLQIFLRAVENASTIEEILAAAYDMVPNISTTNKPKKITDYESQLYEQYKTIRGYLKNQPKGMDYVLYSVSALETVKKANSLDMARIQNQVKGMAALLYEIDNQFKAVKTGSATRASFLDYSDMEQYCYQILTDKVNSGMRDVVRNRYKYIFIDECQDVSAIQHAIINAIKTDDNNIFYVGDIKQSIYRFRHADPLTFLSMRDSYSEAEDAEKRLIYFQENYRSSGTIIACVNAVFDNLMERSLTEIDYQAGDHLIQGIAPENDKHTPTVIKVINGEIEKDPVTDKAITDSLQAQSKVAAEMIKSLLAEGYDYKDIVILLRGAKTSAPVIRDWLSLMHIPCYYGGKQNYFQVPEVASLVEILRTINNTYQDYPLIATLRGMPFNFTDNELAEIAAERTKSKNDAQFCELFHDLAEKNTTILEQKCNHALEVIHKWQVLANVLKPSALIWRIIKEYGIYAVQGAMPDGEMRQKNLYAFHQKAIEFESMGNYKLGEFLESINQLQSAKTSDDAVPMSEKDDFVRIMTIHASKGLEFKVVILMDAQKSIHHKAEKSPVRINIESDNSVYESLGVYMPYTNIGRNTRRDNYGINAFAARQFMMELAEEARMLYVAMTRAQEKLIVIGVEKLSKMEKWNETNKEYRVINTNSMLDMIMPTALGTVVINGEGQIVANDLWDISVVKAEAVELEKAAQKGQLAIPTVNNDIDFQKDWQAVRDDVTSLPAKTAVTSLVSHTFTDAESENKTQEETEVKSFELPEESVAPAFMRIEDSTLTSAMIGTATHTYLSQINLKRVRASMESGEHVKNVLNSELEIVRNNILMDEEEVKAIQKNALHGIGEFFKSDLGEELLKAGSNALREKGFVYPVMVDGKEILVQGVVDAMYLNENKHWVLIDYKTDHDTKKETILKKHTMQLNYYREAIERTTRCPVDRMVVVAVRTGEIVDVPLTNVEYH